MSDLLPLPLSNLIRRAAKQYDREQAVFDLPRRKFHGGIAGRDFSVEFHGERAATPVGPAAGPHTQMAQNIALAWLAGARIMELKTIQVHDRLEIPRPCIDMETIGFNVEWSQELEVDQSALEYAKAKYLIKALEAMQIPEGMKSGEADTVFDVSVGYDLDGVRSNKVTGFLRAMKDASRELESVRWDLRRNLPREHLFLAELPLEPEIAGNVTLSTFHGCPPDQIESICTYLIEELGFHVVVKMNPTLLGAEAANDMLRGTLGYDELVIPDSAFEHDPDFETGVELLSRLRDVGRKAGKTVGAKFTNTLIVKNHKSMFDDEVMYLSGQPLYVLSFHLAALFRKRMGADFPISYSAGIDSKNYTDAVASGFTPITVCTDLLRPGGYGRLSSYHRALAKAMKEAGAATIADFIIAADGAGDDPGDAGAVREASLRNHERAAKAALEETRYRAADNRTPPKQIESRLELFNCINCDKCIPVCPNDAMFSYETAQREIICHDLVVTNGELVPAAESTVVIGGGKKATHQIANWAGFCNECGNCEVFCPEAGGPFIEKPRVFTSREAFDGDRFPGFHFEKRGASLVVQGRWGGAAVQLIRSEDGTDTFWDGHVELTFTRGDSAPSESRILVPAEDGHEVPVQLYHSMAALAEGLLAPESSSYLTIELEGEEL